MMTLSVTKIPDNSIGVYANLAPQDKPVLLHRINIQWLDKNANAVAGNAFYPNQFLEAPIGILVASMPIMAGAAKVRASANYEVISDVATSPVLPL
jgi:hypothetical protein